MSEAFARLPKAKKPPALGSGWCDPGQRGKTFDVLGLVACNVRGVKVSFGDLAFEGIDDQQLLVHARMNSINTGFIVDHNEGYHQP